MKKQYMTPEAIVHTLAMHQMVCVSLGKSTDSVDDVKDLCSRRRRRDRWEDEWDEEEEEEY